MKYETINEKRSNTLNEIINATDEVAYKRLQLKDNLKNIEQILRLMKKTKRVISSLTFLKSYWLKNIDYETHLKSATQRLKDFSNAYEIAILKRKLLKNEFKRAQRKLSKKQKKIGAFDEKYFPRED